MIYVIIKSIVFTDSSKVYPKVSFPPSVWSLLWSWTAVHCQCVRSSCQPRTDRQRLARQRGKSHYCAPGFQSVFVFSRQHSHSQSLSSPVAQTMCDLEMGVLFDVQAKNCRRICHVYFCCVMSKSYHCYWLKFNCARLDCFIAQLSVIPVYGCTDYSERYDVKPWFLTFAHLCDHCRLLWRMFTKDRSLWHLKTSE